VAVSLAYLYTQSAAEGNGHTFHSDHTKNAHLVFSAAYCSSLPADESISIDFSTDEHVMSFFFPAYECIHFVS
jgi:hypothetical protein